uniref:SNARE-like domain protein n=1 Tax=Trichuris muris TaxID=70415 RepID=A0A5S6QQ57_TRIMR
MSRRALFLFFILLISSTLAVYVFTHFPPLEAEERRAVKLPRSLEDAKFLGLILRKYKEKHYGAVLGAIVVAYVFLQSFAIPGSVFLSILSGYLFPFWTALALVCLCSAVGASNCYVLSSMLGKSLIVRLWPGRFDEWSKKVAENAEHMVFYMIFLRITPIFPNWSINLAAPFVDVPFRAFFLGTFLGVAPPSLLFIQAGKSLNDLVTLDNPLAPKRLAILLLLSLLSLLPVYARDWTENGMANFKRWKERLVSYFVLSESN